MAIDLAELEARARAAESKTIPGAYWSVLVGGDELLALIGLARYGANIASVCKPDPHPAAESGWEREHRAGMPVPDWLDTSDITAEDLEAVRKERIEAYEELTARRRQLGQCEGTGIPLSNCECVHCDREPEP